MTHEHIKALDDLIAAVEREAVISMNAREACDCLGWEFPDIRIKWLLSSEIGSLDAAKALHEALLPDLLWEITPLGNVYIRDIEYNQLSRAFVTSNPARAWLIAILKAYRAITEGSE